MRKNILSVGSRPLRHQTPGGADQGHDADFAAVNLKSVCWRSIRMKVPHTHRCIAADVAIAAIENNFEGRDSDCPFAVSGIDHRGVDKPDMFSCSYC